MLRLQQQPEQPQTAATVTANRVAAPLTAPSVPPRLTAQEEEVVRRTRRTLAEERARRTFRPIRLLYAAPALALLLWLLVRHTDYLGYPRGDLFRSMLFSVPMTLFYILWFSRQPTEAERDAAVRLAQYPVPDALPVLLDTWRPAHHCSVEDSEHEKAMARVLPEQLRLYGNDAARSDSATGPLDARTARLLASRLASLYVPFFARYWAPKKRLTGGRAELLVSLIRLLHHCDTPDARRTLRRIAGSRARNEHESLVRDVAAACLAETEAHRAA